MFICLAIQPPDCLFIRTPSRPPTRPSICVCLAICLPTNPFACLPFYMSVNESVDLSLRHAVKNCVWILHMAFCHDSGLKAAVVYKPLVLLVSLAGLGWLCLLCLLVVDSYFICLCCRYSALSLHTWGIRTARSITRISLNKTLFARPSVTKENITPKKGLKSTQSTQRLNTL